VVEVTASFLVGRSFLADVAFEGAWGASARPLPLVAFDLKGGDLVASFESANGPIEAIVGPAEASMRSRRASRDPSLSARRASTVTRSSGIGVEDIRVE